MNRFFLALITISLVSVSLLKAQESGVIPIFQQVNELSKQKEFDRALALVESAQKEFPESWFDAISKEDLRLRDSALQTSKTLHKIILPENYNSQFAYPVIFIFHGGGRNLEGVINHWKAPVLAKGFIRVYLQSYRHFDSDSLGWRSGDTKADSAVQNIYSTVCENYDINGEMVYTAGMSAGATYAVDVFLRNVIPATGFLTFCPGFPSPTNISIQPILHDYYPKNGVIIAGEDDFYHDKQQQLIKKLDTLEIPYKYHLLTGEGHSYPTNENYWVNRGISELLEMQTVLGSDSGITTLTLDGAPYLQGLTHGALLKDRIKDKIFLWDTFLQEEFNVSRTELQNRLFEKTKYEVAISESAPYLLEEIHGIADGCEENYQTILALNLGEELEILAGSGELKERCTAISVNATDSTPTLLAQNMDPPPWIHGDPLLIRYTYPDKTILTYSFPGFSGLNGLNSAGVGITCNSISMLNHSTDGLPVFAVVRKTLNCNSLKEATNLLATVSHATPQCYTIGGQKKALCFECSPNSVKQFFPFGDENITIHTNFSIVNKDFSNQYIELLKAYGKTTEDPYFCPRYFLLYDLVKESRDQLTIETIHSILSMREPAVSPINNVDTYGTLIMEISDPPVMHLYPGRPDEVKERVNRPNNIIEM